jgi:hypothetical protein
VGPITLTGYNFNDQSDDQDYGLNADTISGAFRGNTTYILEQFYEEPDEDDNEFIIYLKRAMIMPGFPSGGAIGLLFIGDLTTYGDLAYWDSFDVPAEDIRSGVGGKHGAGAIGNTTSGVGIWTPNIKYFAKPAEDQGYQEITRSEYFELGWNIDLSWYSAKMEIYFPPNTNMYDPPNLEGDFFRVGKAAATAAGGNNLNARPSKPLPYLRSTDQLLARPGLPGVMKATMVYSGTDLSVGEDDFTEGVGGNGGAVFVGWGDHVNTAAEP